MITQNKKAISAVIATIMLLMVTVSLIGVFYVFSSTLATQTTSSGGERASQLAAQLSMCMQVDNIAGNQIILRNCGKGVIENKSLVVTMDDVALVASTNTIAEGNSSVVNISGLWQVPFGKHNLKITNGAAVAQSLVEIIPNPDGLAGSWNFDEGSGTKAYDNSGNGNVGTLTNMNTTDNATSGWTTGRFGSGLQFDGTNDYVDVGNGASLNITNAIAISAWIKPLSTGTCGDCYGMLISKGGWGGVYWTSIRVDGNVLFYLFGIDNWVISSQAILYDGNWHKVTLTYDASGGSNNMKYYRDGVLILQQTKTGTIKSSTYNVNIGKDAGSATYFQYNGSIDGVHIWSKAFSQDETVAMKQII